MMSAVKNVSVISFDELLKMLQEEVLRRGAAPEPLEHAAGGLGGLELADEVRVVVAVGGGRSGSSDAAQRALRMKRTWTPRTMRKPATAA